MLKKIVKFLSVMAVVVGFPLYLVAWYLYRIAIVQDNSKAFWEKEVVKLQMQKLMEKIKESKEKVFTDVDEEEVAKEAVKRYPDYSEQIEKGRKWLESQEQEEVYLQSYDGLQLFARFVPAADPDAGKVMILMHGFRAKEYTDFAGLMEFYHNEGFHLLIPHQRSHGKSEGKYLCFGMKERYDAQKWAFYINNRFHGSCVIFLHGVSMGGATVVMASGLDLPEQVKGIIDDCGFTTAWEEFEHVLKQNFHLPKFPILYMADKITQAKAGFAFKEYSTLEALKRNTIPMLFIHGGEDDFVPTEMGRRNYEACKAPKDLLIVDGANHAVSSLAAPEQYQAKVRKFIETCLK